MPYFATLMRCRLVDGEKTVLGTGSFLGQPFPYTVRELLILALMPAHMVVNQQLRKDGMRDRCMQG